MLATDLLASSLPAVLSTSLDAVVVMRQDGTVAGWNGNAEVLTGYSWQQAQGRNMGELIVPPGQRAAHRYGLERWNLTGKGNIMGRRVELDLLHASGRLVPVELAVTSVATDWDPVFLGFMRDISARRAELADKTWQVREMHHRVKNLLGVAASMANLTAASQSRVTGFTRVFTGRLQAMARAQEVLAEADWGPCDLQALVAGAVQGLQLGREARITYAGPPVQLAARHAAGFVGLLHELVTNSEQYGALSQPAGTVYITWEVLPGRVQLRWQELGGPPVAEPPAAGGGMGIVSSVARYELRGAAQWQWPRSGLDLLLYWPHAA